MRILNVLVAGDYFCHLLLPKGQSLRSLDKKRLDPLIEESLELTRMMGASVATARRKLEQEGDMEI